VEQAADVRRTAAMTIYNNTIDMSADDIAISKAKYPAKADIVEGHRSCPRANRQRPLFCGFRLGVQNNSCLLFLYSLGRPSPKISRLPTLTSSQISICLFRAFGKFVRVPAWLWSSQRLLSTLCLSGLTTLLLAIVLFDPVTRFPGWPALLPVFGTMAVIFARPEATPNRLLSNKVIVSVGLISYPYLWHWPLISFAAITGSGTVCAL
jgi:hypothetical protein